MDVNIHRIRSYLSWLTEGQAASAPDPVDDWEEYEVDMDRMIKEARAAGDEVFLKRSIDALLADPEGRIDMFVGQVFAFSDEDLVDLFSHAFDYIWPDDIRSAPGEGPEVAFVSMTDAEWDIRRGRA